MSGFISLAQIIFRLLELIFEPFPDYWLYIQIVFSIGGIIASILYFKLGIINEEEDLDDYNKIKKNILNIKFYVLFILLIIIMSSFIFYIMYHIMN